MMADIGEMRHRISIYKPTGQDDWVTEESEQLICKAWASISYVGDKTYWEAQSNGATITDRIIIRYRKNVDRTMIIRYGDRIFDIDTVRDLDERKRFLVLLVRERL